MHCEVMPRSYKLATGYDDNFNPSNTTKTTAILELAISLIHAHYNVSSHLNFNTHKSMG